MIVGYRGMNKRLKPHIGTLPNLIEMVEESAIPKYKCKMHMRSRIQQIQLTERAPELLTFVKPLGRT